MGKHLAKQPAGEPQGGAGTRAGRQRLQGPHEGPALYPILLQPRSSPWAVGDGALPRRPSASRLQQGRSLQLIPFPSSGIHTPWRLPQRAFLLTPASTTHELKLSHLPYACSSARNTAETWTLLFPGKMETLRLSTDRDLARGGLLFGVLDSAESPGSTVGSWGGQMHPHPTGSPHSGSRCSSLPHPDLCSGT